jgi:hypothetical protein
MEKGILSVNKFPYWFVKSNKNIEYPVNEVSILKYTTWFNECKEVNFNIIENIKKTKYYAEIYKNSDLLKLKLIGFNERDSNFIKINKKIIKEERIEKFEEIWLPLLKIKTDVKVNLLYSKFTLESDEHGIIKFYPKSNKIHIQNTKETIQPGLQ